MLTSAQEGAGAVVGRFGGPLMLPVDVSIPDDPFVASVDLSALPADASDLPLPTDGRLLFFAWPESDYPSPAGQVLYVPAGTTVTERDRHAWNPRGIEQYRAMFDSYPQGPMRWRADLSLPCHWAIEIPHEPWSAALPGHPHAEELVQVWREAQDDIAPSELFQLGGYADEEVVHLDPVDIAVATVTEAVKAGSWEGPVSADSADWVLLADWHAGRDVTGYEGSTVHWVIQRDDLAARRLERAFTTVYWNP
ncbi:YwqG family protein [Streptomyces cellulosae]